MTWVGEVTKEQWAKFRDERDERIKRGCPKHGPLVMSLPDGRKVLHPHSLVRGSCYECMLDNEAIEFLDWVVIQHIKPSHEGVSILRRVIAHLGLAGISHE